MFKKTSIVAVAAIVLLMLTTTPVAAAVPSAFKNSLSITDYQTENVYSTGEAITLSADAAKDVLVMAGDVVIDGNVAGNLYAMGGNVVVNGTINGDINVVGGAVIINSDQPGDVRVAAGMLFLNSKSIAGDLAVFAGQSSINPEAVIGGVRHVNTSMSLTSNGQPSPTTITELKSNFTNWDNEEMGRITSRVGVIVGSLVTVAALLMFVGTYFVQLAVITFFPVLSNASMKLMREKKLQTVMIGTLVLFASPFIGLFLILTVIGIPFLGLLIALGFIVLIFSSAYPSYLLGEYLFAKFNITRTGVWLKLAIGYIALNLGLTLLVLVPIVGWGLHTLITFFLTVWSVGAMLVYKWNKVQTNK